MKNINLPNFLTFSRLILTFIVLFLLFRENLFNNEIVRIIIVIIVYIIAAVTDYYDGHFARLFHKRTEFGSFMDSLIDKTFVLGVFYAFLFINSLEINPYLIYIITAREVLITLLRIYMTLTAKPMITEEHGKIKTTMQISVQIILLLILCLYAFTYESTGFQKFIKLSSKFIWDISQMEFENYYISELNLPSSLLNIVGQIPNTVIFIVTLYTVFSGTIYLLKHRSLIFKKSKK